MKFHLEKNKRNYVKAPEEQMKDDLGWNLDLKASNTESKDYVLHNKRNFRDFLIKCKE